MRGCQSQILQSGEVAQVSSRLSLNLRIFLDYVRHCVLARVTVQAHMNII